MNTSDNIKKTQSSGDLPWIVFALHEHTYAVNSLLVTGIILIPDTVPVPDAKKVFRGIGKIRGMVLPLLDMRLLFEMPTMQQEYEAFCRMVDQRKQDHINWVTALNNSVKDGTDFNLATDPHACAFGKWYYNFKTENHLIRSQLNKIEEPHRLLHETAVTVKKIKSEPDSETKEKHMREALSKAENIYMPQILTLLDETKNTIHHETHEMVLTLTDDINNKESVIGIIVDDVKAVQQIEMVCEADELHKIHRNKYISGVAKNPMYKGEIMVLDEHEVIKLAKAIDISSAAGQLAGR